MAKRRYGIDEKKITRFQKEGRGDGHGAEYKPWLSVHDVSSHGRSARIHSYKTGREHHFLSDMETSFFLLFDWSDQITDIREQFPLDRDVTRQIAEEMGVKHPIDIHSRTDIVMTTDFLLDVASGSDRGNTLVARAVKPVNELGKKRVLEKLEIERRYWRKKGVDWALITEKELPKQRIKNLHWLREMQSFENMVAPHPDYWQDRCNRFLACLPRASNMTIKNFIYNLEESQGFAKDDGLTVLRHLAANKMISFDLDVELKMTAPIDALNFIVEANKVSARMIA